MKRRIVMFAAVSLSIVSLAGCAPLIVGGLLGGVGVYAVSKDTIQGETDKQYDILWDAAVTVARIRGTVKVEDSMKGQIEAQIESSRVWIKLIRLTDATTRMRISARRFHMPNLALAQDMFVKVMDQAK